MTAPLLAALDAIKAKASAPDSGSDPYEVARAAALMEGYHARWADEPLEILAVEAEFRSPLVNPATRATSRTYDAGGKIDMIVRDVRGRTWVVEHKTTTLDISTGSDYWKRLRIDGQVSLYFDGARALGHAVAGCLYDVIARPQLKPYKATPPESRRYTKAGKLDARQHDRDETPLEFLERVRNAIAENPERYYQRGEVVRIGDELDEARRDVWRTARLIREAELTGEHPRNPDACVQAWGSCEFFDHCTGAASLDDGSRFRKRERAHHELSVTDDGDLPLVTISRLRTFRTCPRLHHLKYDLLLESNADRAAARFGTLFHAGLEAWGLALMAEANAFPAPELSPAL